ncbi:MAG: uroporphyrinogen decarboxylase [Caldilineae bacterium]|nr:uroporphyrinogen decarboxylase [Anaerolineae bacterium]MCB9153944.1 uroporphyrinogen decarboxylase [Caldilineae bacterium]
MTTAWQRVKQAARLETPDQVPVALIVDSPWLPGYAGIHTLDFFLDPDRWFDIHRSLLDRWPDVAWIPGFWVEYGMASEPSAFGARMHWHHDRPPSIEPVVEDPEHWANAPLPNVREDGLMPLVLRLYERTEARLQAEGLGINMVAARGPMVTAGWIMGLTSLMTGLVERPEVIQRCLENITTTLIDWLQAQLDTLNAPEGILLLDDIVGMVSVDHYNEYVAPHLQRIFAQFDGLVRIYHNDTPCPHLYPSLADAGFDVFNFTHEVDIAIAKEAMGHRVALMGNVPPLHIAVRESPEVVAEFTQACLDRGAPGGGMILSVGGGVSPDTPAASIDAMVDVAKAWQPPQPGQPVAEWDDLLERFKISNTGKRTRDRRRRDRRA